MSDKKWFLTETFTNFKNVYVLLTTSNGLPRILFEIFNTESFLELKVQGGSDILYELNNSYIQNPILVSNANKTTNMWVDNTG